VGGEGQPLAGRSRAELFPEHAPLFLHEVELPLQPVVDRGGDHHDENLQRPGPHRGQPARSRRVFQAPNSPEILPESSRRLFGRHAWLTDAGLAVYQRGPSARSISAVHRRGPSARSIGAVHQRGPSARSIGAVHQRGPSARSIRSKPGLSASLPRDTKHDPHHQRPRIDACHESCSSQV
jgi:hypothetical protein